MENWVLKNKKADFKQIMDQFHVSEVIARCLVNKGLVDHEEIEKYLNPSIKHLHNPLEMKDMKKACEILLEKIKHNKKIRIIGDYDVDGVISTYILYRALKKIGANVDYEIPDRIKDGYGINCNMVDAAHREQVDTLLTCDNGIAAIEQIKCAKEYGMTVIITDHHSLVQLENGEEVLPCADAVLNPKQPDCIYPFSGLCGAAVAYKLILALNNYFEVPQKEAFEEELISYVAIATVCDVMDLVQENRFLVKHGLYLLKQTKNKGLLALMNVSGIEKEQLNVFHLGFVIGPCLNASGRLDSAKKGLKLLLTENEEQAIELAGEVRDLNEQRKNMTAQNVDKAIQIIENSGLKDDKVLVIYLQDCHESLAGIIAGRLRERYHKPAIVLTDAEDCVKGSARSIEHYNIFVELMKCRELLLKVGGHPMAAGLSLKPENVDILRQYLNEKTTLTEDMLIPKVSIDIHLPLGYVSENLVEELKILEPFGKGNEKPLFAEKDLNIKSMFMLGKNGSGVRLRVENQYGACKDAIYFGDVNALLLHLENTYGKEEVNKLKTGRYSKVKLMITYFPRLNEYNNTINIQLMIQNYR